MRSWTRRPSCGRGRPRTLADPLFRLPGYGVKRLTPEDAGGLQGLFDRSEDYFRMISGSPAEAGEALREIAGPPPANTAADRFPMGVFAADELVGYLGLLRDYPDMKDWWVGLLLLDPRERGSGLGARIYRAASRWTADLGGRSHGLGVVEENVAGKRFWERNGFRESRRESYRVGAKEHTLIVMRRRLGGGRAGAQEHL